MPTFAVRLQQKIAEHSPLCVGIDPSAALLKSCNLPNTPDGAFEFGKRVLEAADFRISLLKPQSAFFERFGKTVGVAPMAYLLAWCMGLAKQWLRQGQRRIAEVAERVGYRSASAFSVAFTRCVGQSPGQYARGDG